MKKIILLFMIFNCFQLIASQSDSYPKSDSEATLGKIQNDAYSGIDPQGNFFRGNTRTGFYFNYGTGVTCYGTHQNRTCYTKKN